MKKAKTPKVNPINTMEIELRGNKVKIAIPPTAFEAYSMATFAALYAMNNPEVDKILKAFGMQLLDVEGNELFKDLLSK